MAAPVGLLCDAGRCAQMVEALATARARWVRAQGEQLAAMFGAMVDDPEFGATPQQRALVPALLERHVAALSGTAA